LSALASLLLALLLGWGGSRLASRCAWSEERRPRRMVYALLLGCLGLHLALTACDFLGVAWTAASMLLPLGLGIAATFWRRPARREPSAFPSDLGWGDGAALAALILFALFSATLWITTPDWIFHWGLKAHRFYLQQGIDYAYLVRPWNWSIHPDYPNLFPELLAATSLLVRRFEPAGLMAWTSLFFALLLLSCRGILGTLTSERRVRQAGLAFLALGLAAFGLGHQMAGAADWMPALALAAATPALLRRPDRDGDFEVSVAAAFSAASKMEGISLAFFLLAVQALRRIGRERRLDFRSLLLLGTPSGLVVLLWALQARRYGLFQPFNSGRLDWVRAAPMAEGLREALLAPTWHGLAALVFLPPILLLARRVRPFALVATLQLVFYFYVYLAAPVDTRYYVITSFPRLSLQLIPAVLAVAFGLLGEPEEGEVPAPREGGTTGPRRKKGAAGRALPAS